MSNDFIYNMSQINEETIFNGWQEMIAEDGSVWETGYDDDYIPGLDDGEAYDPIMGDGEGFDETDDEWLDDYQGEEDFA